MIIKAIPDDARVVSEVGAIAFAESHAGSAPAHEIKQYIDSRYNPDTIRTELQRPDAVFHFISHKNRVAGYSKLLPDSTCPSTGETGLSKLEQIYLLHEFTGLGLGSALLAFNMELSKSLGQKGMWLEVWTGNTKGIAFYERLGFEIIEEGRFRLTDTHSNPHYVMRLLYNEDGR